MSGGNQTPQTEVDCQAGSPGVGVRNDGVLETVCRFSPILLPRKVPENQEEEEEERAELNQPEEPEAAESSTGGP